MQKRKAAKVQVKADLEVLPAVHQLPFATLPPNAFATQMIYNNKLQLSLDKRYMEIEALRKKWYKGVKDLGPMPLKLRDLLIQEHYKVRTWLESERGRIQGSQFETPRLRGCIREKFLHLYRQQYKLFAKTTGEGKLRGILLKWVCFRY